MEGLALMRREGLDLKTAARLSGTTPTSMIRHLAPRALRRGRDGRWHPTRTDTIERRIDMLTTEGRTSVRPTGSREASRIGQHHNAVGAFIRRHPRGERDLARFKGERAAGFEFETNLDTLERDALRGEHSAESIYEITP